MADRPGRPGRSRSRRRSRRASKRPGHRLGETRAWGWGGYYARIFLNVEGREPQGIIPAEDYEKREELLADGCEGIRGPRGEAWATQVIKPKEYFAELGATTPT